MTDIPHIHPISARAVTPMSKDEWEEQYQLGAFLAGPFNERDPQLAKRVAAEYGEPSNVENVAAFLHDECVQCEECRMFWLADEETAPSDSYASEGMFCEDCGEGMEIEPSYAYQNRSANGYRGNL